MNEIIIPKNVSMPSDNYFKLILGSYTKTKWPLDIFPIFKWLPYVCFGLIIGKYMKDHNLESQINYEASDYQYIEISNPEKNDDL